MAIQFQCSQCGVQFNVGAELAGTMARCNSCGNVVTVPAPQPAPRKKPPPVVAPQQIPVARIESPAPKSLPVARMEVAPAVALTPLAPTPAVPGLKRPVYQFPSQAPRSGGPSVGMWLAIGGGVAALLLLGVGIVGTIAVSKMWPKQIAAI